VRRGEEKEGARKCCSRAGRQKKREGKGIKSADEERRRESWRWETYVSQRINDRKCARVLLLVLTQIECLRHGGGGGWRNAGRSTAAPPGGGLRNNAKDGVSVVVRLTNLN